MFNEYLYFIREKILDSDYNETNSYKVLNYRKKKQLFKRLYKNTNNWRVQLMKIETENFKALKAEKQKEYSTKLYKNSRLAIVGRGWIKAGFDFGKFTDNNFIYNTKTNSIHFIGLKPVILSKVINPWFIPEEGVEGFEFLIVERGARMNYEYTKKVKQCCLEKLESQALRHNIIEKALSNAETQLKEFFSILTGKNIKGVYFHSDYLDYMQDELFQKPGAIVNESIIDIDSTLLHYVTHYPDVKDQVSRIKKFLDTLSTSTSTIYGDTIQLNNYSGLLFNVLKDRSFDSNDVKLIVNKKLTLTDTIWLTNLTLSDTTKAIFSNDYSFKPEYKEFIIAAFDSTYSCFSNDLNKILNAWNINDTINGWPSVN